jgi:hypothetical protein
MHDKTNAGPGGSGRGVRDYQSGQAVDLENSRSSDAAQDIAIGTIPKNSREELRIALRTFKGYRRIDIRVHADNGKGERVPTAKGVTVRPDAAHLLIDALVKARDVSIAEGLIEADSTAEEGRP